MTLELRTEVLRRHATVILVAAAFVVGTSFVLLGGSYDAAGWRGAIFWIGLVLKLPFSATAELVELVFGRVVGNAGVEIASAAVLVTGAVFIDVFRARRARRKG